MRNRSAAVCLLAAWLVAVPAAAQLTLGPKPLRIVLLGDSQELLPPAVYANHIAEEDLNQQSFGLDDLKQYFRVFSRCRVELDEPRIESLAAESMKRAQEIQANDPTVPEPKALADAVLEKSNALEAVAAQKGEANGN